MLAQRRRQLTYINPALSILQRKQDRSTPAQCFHNGKIRLSNVAFMLGRHCTGHNNTRHTMTTIAQYEGDIII